MDCLSVIVCKFCSASVSLKMISLSSYTALTRWMIEKISFDTVLFWTIDGASAKTKNKQQQTKKLSRIWKYRQRLFGVLTEVFWGRQVCHSDCQTQILDNKKSQCCKSRNSPLSCQTVLASSKWKYDLLVGIQCCHSWVLKLKKNREKSTRFGNRNTRLFRPVFKIVVCFKLKNTKSKNCQVVTTFMPCLNTLTCFRSLPLPHHLPAMELS